MPVLGGGKETFPRQKYSSFPINIDLIFVLTLSYFLQDLFLYEIYLRSTARNLKLVLNNEL